jgi:tRNA (cmo5U34)-methyltransferase
MIVDSTPGGWEFTPEVTAGFDAHIAASVPHYHSVQEQVADLAAWFAPRRSVVADLGAATGTTAALIARRYPRRRLQFWLYDRSETMLAAAAAKLGPLCEVAPRLRAGTIEVLPLDHPPAGLTLCLWTLQFLRPDDREQVLAKARAGAAADGALVVAEKLRLRHPLWAEIGISATNDQKSAAGASPDEICAKERSLRGVLIPWSDQDNRDALRDAGWGDVEVLWRWHQWVVYVALARP